VSKLPVTPDDLINTAGDGQEKSTDVTGKLTGSWQGPWGVKVSPIYRELGQFVPPTARHRAAAGAAHRRQAGLVTAIVWLLETGLSTTG